MSKDVLEKYGQAPEGTPSYREATVRRALRVRFWTRLAFSTVILALLGGLYMVIPAVVIWVVGICVGIVAGLQAIIWTRWAIKQHNNSAVIIEHVKKTGVMPDE